MKQTAGDRIFAGTNYLLIIVFTILVAYPFLWCVILSFNDGMDAQKGGIYFWPRDFTLDNYRFVFSSGDVLVGARTSILRTVLGTLGGLFVTSIFAYAMSKRELLFRRVYMIVGLITMFFGGGLIPYVLVIRLLGLYNSFFVYVLPGLFSMFHGIVFMTFFRTIPASLEESATIDGANDFYVYARIIVPVSKPVFATIALFMGVGHWNAWFDNMLFVRNEGLQTLSFFLTKMISAQQFADTVMSKQRTGVGATSSGMTSVSLMLAAMVVTAFPIMVLYPFLQKHFAKGVMLGSLKG